MEANIGIKREQLAAIATVLSKVLADEFVLSTKTRNAHWNVEGPNFHSMHLFFEEHYHKLDEIIDETAERIRQLGHYAPATLKQFLQLTHLSEQSREKNNSEGFIRELLADHESIIIYLRETVNNNSGDAGSLDYLTSLIETHEKIAWMLRSHLA